MSQTKSGILGLQWFQFGVRGYKDMSPPTRIDETDLGTGNAQRTSRFEVDDGQHLHSP